ncbi:MAG: chemotaxis protein CheW [Planctomycetaceae bacterium]
MDDELIQEFLLESWENLGQLDVEIVELEKRPDDNDLIASIFRTIHTIKGTCGFLGLSRLGAVSHSTENVLGQMREGKLEVTSDAISLVLCGVDQIKELLAALEANGKEPNVDNSDLINRLDGMAAAAAADPPVSSEAPAAAPVPAPTDMQPATMNMQPTESPTPAVESPASGDPPETPSSGEGESAHRSSVSDLSIRVNVNVLDGLMNQVGELVLTRNQLTQLARGDDDSKYSGPIAHLNRITTDLQDGVMKTRMQPIGNAWNKLPRLVRDLSNSMGKTIQLEMSGEDTELDRTVLDAIRDPLTHIIRNSADHGIESPEVRRERGKPEAGTIRLTAFHEGGHVIIRIEDDGAGVNVDKVRQIAISKGVVTEAAASAMPDSEVVNLIFAAGFSTAESVSSVSGRGVGMDVVRTQIAKIGGTADLASRAGLGMTIIIKIPLTLAIISALVVEGGGETFAIPQLGVVELVRLAPEERERVETIHNRQVLRLRDRLLPLIRLDEVLEIQTVEDDPDESDVNIVVVQAGDERLGLVVTQVFDTEEIVVKPVGTLLKEIEVYQGTTILGDGRVIMILDIAGIAAVVGSRTQSPDADHAIEDLGDHSGTTSLLLFDAGHETPMAVPLSLVSRLEEVPRERIERAGDRLVVQYRGDLLPLMPVAGQSTGTDEVETQPVIVFSEGAKSMGLMVERIIDIHEEQLTIRMQTSRPGVLGTAIVNGSAMEIIDTQHYVLQVDPDWFDYGDGVKSGRILVVDDSPFLRQLAVTALEAEGYFATPAESAKQAVAMLEDGSAFDVIVSDLDMPEMDGFEFAAWIRGCGEGAGTPLIALTAHVAEENEARARAAGFDEFLPKYDAKQLCATVDALRMRSLATTGA